ncbi:helix-turn-helix transcriptional regulator [Nocardia vermiculata]|uniref:Helix-turn-helix domain-containing protein n=1 Tax=Nocardia vermiculata TaxID=257274 RepID=A0A846Y4W9_9NOCA|nr:helix-turn-helix transcriptional regulator [Nocardia vermiculata]NKY52970.1 helix-turn-helix domain-containing protein [Nocardia vermiculata]
MSGDGQLGEFLRARRARLVPDEVGLPRYPGRRRVSGLRREELAQLAGVSVSYYTRLEQGQSANASDSVLEALADALRLDQHERAHLRQLATRRSRPPRRPAPERLHPLTRDLMRPLETVPAVVLGRRTDILAWNALGHALLAGHIDRTAVDRPADRPNQARLLFLDPHLRELYADWPRKARIMVGHLRLVAGQHPDDAALAALIGELSMKSPEFAALWSDHRVSPCAGQSHELRHPVLGSLTVYQQILVPARSPEQSVVVVTAADAGSADSLQLLTRSIRELGAGDDHVAAPVFESATSARRPGA